MIKATIEETGELATIDGVLTRVWKGQTSNGLDVAMYIALIGVPNDTPPEKLAELEHRLMPAGPPPPPRELDLQMTLYALVGAAKRSRTNAVQIVQELIRMWPEVCPECGEVYTLHDSDGNRMCTGCSDPDDVRDFMEPDA
jgi:hypothetical protein